MVPKILALLCAIFSIGGFFRQGFTITIFSASDYCGHYDTNLGGTIVLTGSAQRFQAISCQAVQSFLVIFFKLAAVWRVVICERSNLALQSESLSGTPRS